MAYIKPQRDGSERGGSVPLEKELDALLGRYSRSFSSKIYVDENNDLDLLMQVFGITPEQKRENRQYWGRELGMCWQLLVIAICRSTRSDFSPAIRVGADEPCDLVVGNAAIDTKYRIGSGDSGTLKKFKSYGPILRGMGYEPTLLILRDDNLPAAVGACKTGSWNVIIGSDTLDYLEKLTGFDVAAYLTQRAGAHAFSRP